MHKTLVVLAIVGILAIVLIIGLVSRKTSPSSCPAVCPPGDYCDDSTGYKCVSAQAFCGPRLSPPGSTCTFDKLVCNPKTRHWECPICPQGYEGYNCQCNIADKAKIKAQVDVCSKAQIAICQPDGSYQPGASNNCAQIDSYLADVGSSLAETCGSLCAQNTEIFCIDSPLPHFGCKTTCKPKPDPNECATGNQCPSGEICLCDETTDNTWKCQEIMHSQCDPKVTGSCILSDGTPATTECHTCGQDGYINYCMGSRSFPVKCLIADVPLTPNQVGDDGTTIYFDPNHLPVYPAVDNELCKNTIQRQPSTTFLSGEYDNSYEMINSPNGYLYLDANKKRQFHKADPSDLFYPAPSGQEYVNCWWDDHPSCQNKGVYTQLCTDEPDPKKTRPCKPGDISNRLKQGFCACPTYHSNFSGKDIPYLGPACEFDDNDTCQGHGSVDANGTCTCGQDYAGTNCQYSRSKDCDGNGYPRADGSCVCDKNYAGVHCEYSRDKDCSKQGTPKLDGSCICDTGFAGPKSKCQYSGANACNNHGIPDPGRDDGTCKGFCDQHYAGDHCQFSRDATCYGHGEPLDSGACACDSGWVGSQCQHSAGTDCNSHGSVNPDGSCNCSVGYAGPHSKCQYSRAKDCNGHGDPVGDDGICTGHCDSTYAGAHCELSRADCSNNGNPRDDKTCDCDKDCAGSICQYTSANTCNGHGTPQADGTCSSCDQHYAGAHCEHSRDKDCSGYGDPKLDGSCICDTGHAGPNTKCKFSRADCSGHGNPDSSKDTLTCLCDDGWEGACCGCSIADKIHTPTDVCEKEEIAVCQDTCKGPGKYVVQTATTCSQIASYLKDIGSTLPATCGHLCTNSQIACLDDPLRFQCTSVCKAKPDSSDECDNVTRHCPSDKICMCDDSTSNLWKCEPINVTNCAHRNPGSCVYPDGTPAQETCLNCGDTQGQGINYCLGTHSVPLDCLRTGVPLSNVPEGSSQTKIWINSASSLPIYPTIDNDLCKLEGSAEKASTDKLPGYWDASYNMVGNPEAYLYTAPDKTRQINVISPSNPLAYFYSSPATKPEDNINCWWDDHPVCQHEGLFVQSCTDPQGQPRDCTSQDIQNRQKAGRCDCSKTSYVSAFDGKTKAYVGINCELSDNDTCQGHGAVNTGGDCTCGPGYAGPHTNCHFSRADCNGHGIPDSTKDNLTCICDSGWHGSTCTFSRQTTCSNHGDPNDQGNCTCDSYVGYAGLTRYQGKQCQFDDSYCSNQGSVGLDQTGNPACICDGQINWGTKCENHSLNNLCNNPYWTWTTDKYYHQCGTLSSPIIPCQGYSQECGQSYQDIPTITVNSDHSISMVGAGGVDKFSSPGAVNDIINFNNGQHVWKADVQCSGNGTMVNGACQCFPNFSGNTCSDGLSGYYYITIPSEAPDKQYIQYDSPDGGTYKGPKDGKPLFVSFQRNANKDLLILYADRSSGTNKYLAWDPSAPGSWNQFFLRTQLKHAVNDINQASKFFLMPTKGGYYLQYLGFTNSFLCTPQNNDNIDFSYNGNSAPIVVNFEYIDSCWGQCSGQHPDCCNGTCVNFQNDPDNCGNCQNSCYNGACGGRPLKYQYHFCCQGKCSCCTMNGCDTCI